MLLLAAALAAPAEQPKPEVNEDLAASEKDDLKTEASHWGGGHWGGYGGKIRVYNGIFLFIIFFMYLFFHVFFYDDFDLIKVSLRDYYVLTTLKSIVSQNV